MADEPLGQRAEIVINELLGWLTGPDSGQNDGLTDAVALIQEALAANADLTARVEEVKAERDLLHRAVEELGRAGTLLIGARDAALARAEAAEAREGRLREALKPQLSVRAREVLTEWAEALEAMSEDADDRIQASAIRFLLERQDAARAALATETPT